MRLSIPAAISFSLLSATAFANPVWTSRLSASPVQGPHVLLIHTCDPAMGACSAEFATYYGTSHSDWEVGNDTSADTGSGYRTLKTRQVCDCHVPTGVQLTYRIDYVSTTVSASASLDQPATSGTCAAECLQADLRPDGGAAVDVGTLPDVPITMDGAPGTDGATLPTGTGGGPGTGGMTVVAGTGGALGTGGATVPTGSGGAPGTGGATVLAGTGGAPTTGGTTVSASGGAGGAASKGGGFCAIAPHAPPTALPILCLFAGLALAIRRRRGA